MKNEINQLNREISYGIMVTLSKKAGHDGMKFFNENIEFLLNHAKSKILSVSKEDIDRIVHITNQFEEMHRQADDKFLKYVLSQIIQQLIHFVELLKPFQE